MSSNITLRDASTERLVQEANAEDRTLHQDHQDSCLSDQDLRRILRLLYTSHFLSAWNSRIFEFGAFLFLAEIYPGTLLPASVYALTRAASAAILSPWIGPYIDQADRLRVVRASIVGQRLAVTLSCTALFLMACIPLLRHDFYASSAFLFLLCFLAGIEKLSSVLNTISVERDWVVTIAAENEERLRSMNSQMRRIDLFCKLVGPLIIALVDGASSKIAIIVTGSMSGLSVLVEYFTIYRVYEMAPMLASPKPSANLATGKSSVWARIKGAAEGITRYVLHPAFLPSLSLALLYLTVLSFAGQMITYLLALGVSSGLIGVLRGISAAFELSATWIAPKTIKHIGPVRAGIWFLNCQIVCVAVACAFFWFSEQPAVTAAGTVSAVIASRVGLWGFDLSAQLIVQEEVEEDLRGTFSSQEFALQNVFEMVAFASTVAFPRPGQFKYPATLSAVAVGSAGVLYATFVRIRRGHLLHLSRCMDRKGHDHTHWSFALPEPRQDYELVSSQNMSRHIELRGSD